MAHMVPTSKPGTSRAPTDPPPRRTHTLVVNDEPVEIDERYSNLVYIARGAYGMVCVADDAVSSQRCTRAGITHPSCRPAPLLCSRLRPQAPSARVSCVC